MIDFRPLIIDSQAMYELLVKPHFADVVTGTDKVPGTLGEFTVMDDVSSKRRIIDILGNRNILKRRDASCNIEFTPIGKGNTRTIETDPIYGATLQCDNEFYQGCLEDFRSQSSVFRDFIMVFFEKAIKVDLDSNAYFGDITRADDATGLWNWNVFDGIFKKYAKYIANGTVPASQTSAIPSGVLTPANAFNTLQWIYDNQNPLLKSMPAGLKKIYVSDALYYGYSKYLQGIGGAYNIDLILNGVQTLRFNEIELQLEPSWSPILNALNGGVAAHAGILTIAGNFIFATDKNYGDGPYLKEALSVWYSLDQRVWKYYMCMRVGTEIALPEHSVIAMTVIS